MIYFCLMSHWLGIPVLEVSANTRFISFEWMGQTFRFDENPNE